MIGWVRFKVREGLWSDCKSTSDNKGSTDKTPFLNHQILFSLVFIVWIIFMIWSPKEWILLLFFLTHSLILVSSIVTDLWVLYSMILEVDSAVCSLVVLSFFAVLTVLELACENTDGINVTAPISSPLCPQHLRLLLLRLCVRVCL